mmetsp:Transcript_1992/g.2787  ORF Transcript_1992/g.2787 Transcript_1992/m.2787 type:complete len:361 (-) Transcript_1992:332-1414(-)
MNLNIASVFLILLSSVATMVSSKEVNGFGLEIAMDGDTMAITSFGSVHIFKKSGSTWKKVKEFDEIGQSPVTIDGNTVYVGDEYNKKVHVFTNTNGNQWTRKKLSSTSTTFGLNLAASQGMLLVSGLGSDGSGTVFSYKNSGDPITMQELAISPRNDHDTGRSMAFHGDKAVLGGNYNLFLFVQSNDGTWTQSDQLKLNKGLTTMPRSVAMYEDVVAVGVNPPVYPFGQGGSVIIYSIKDGKFSKIQTLVGLFANSFGLSVALSKNNLVVGAPEEVFVYEQSKSKANVHYVAKQKFKARNSKKMNLFGQNVVVDDDTILVGAYLTGGVSGGSAYVFSRKDDGKWTQDQELKGDDIVEYLS